MSLGAGEIITLAIVVVVIFSASRMGALGNAIGKFVYSFKKAARGEGFVDVKAQRQDRLSGSRGSEDADVVEEPRKRS